MVGGVEEVDQIYWVAVTLDKVSEAVGVTEMFEVVQEPLGVGLKDTVGPVASF